MTSIITFFSQMSISTFPVILSYMNFLKLKLLYFEFFSIAEKFNIPAIYKSIILIFLVNLPLVFIYKFYNKDIQIQPPGEPRE